MIAVCLSIFLWICDMTGLLRGTLVSWWYSPRICPVVTDMQHYYHARYPTDDWHLAYMFSLVYFSVEVCLVGVFPDSVSTRRDSCIRVDAPLMLASPLTKKNKIEQGWGWGCGVRGWGWGWGGGGVGSGVGWGVGVGGRRGWEWGGEGAWWVDLGVWGVGGGLALHLNQARGHLNWRMGLGGGGGGGGGGLALHLNQARGHLNWRMGLPASLGGNLGCRKV